MTKRSAVCCAVLLTVATCAWSADKPAPAPTHGAKPAAAKKAKAPPAKKGKAPAVKKVKAPPVKKAKAATPMKPVSFAPQPAVAVIPAPKLTGKTETLTCRDGTEDRHARIGVVLRGGEVDSFAYYSKWKPRTCSIYLQRSGDGFSHWSLRGRVTQVKLERGHFLIDHDKGAYRFTFRDIDRERYCGMDGTINGTLTVRKGSEHCEVSGIMEEGVPLGQAWAAAQTAAPPGAAAEPATAPPAQVAQRARPERAYTFPMGVGD
jgi:hypothetical protein